jgi:YgiT-type zinc finger domain-containing protein
VLQDRNKVDGRCPLCGGRKTAGTATFTAELGFGVVVVRKVEATVCEQCGEEWIAPEAARKLESIVADARRQRRQIEVLEFSALVDG